MDTQLLEEYHTLNTIIEQDKAVTSFKYALLRGTIEICQQYSHLARVDADGRIWYPLGLLVERWILYYYPLFEHERFIPQLNGEKDLSKPSKKVQFRKELTAVIEYYRLNGGFSAFYSDYRRGTLPDELQKTMRELIRKTRAAITEGPIQHLGYSHHHDHYSVFNWDKTHCRLPKKPVSPEYLVRNCGEFSLPRELADLFNYFGSFIIGEGTLVSKWADFTVKIGKSQGLTIQKELVLDLLGRTPDTNRQVQEAQRFYHQMLATDGEITCVWSDNPIRSHKDLHVDHLLPFSVWKNNDFWNLMPTHAKINMRKGDAIPSHILLERRADVIEGYWKLSAGSYPETFQQEITAALIGPQSAPGTAWLDIAFENLLEKSKYLIDVRGYPAWDV